MKKTLLLLLTLCLSGAAHADFVTEDQARTQAAAFLTEHSKTRRQIEAASLKSTSSTVRMSPSHKASDKPCYYIFNSADSTSFVIVSAESSTVQILAYSNEGYFHSEDIDKGAEVFLEQYTKEIEAIRAGGLTAEQKASVRKANAATSEGEVLLATAELNQNDGYWNSKYCPLKKDGKYAPAGCVATAGAIIMRYHKWPEKGKGSHSYVSSTYKLSLSRDFSKDTYDWDCIPTTTYSDGGAGWNDKARDEIGKIELACGIASNMNYGYTESSAAVATMVRAMVTYFSYAIDYKHYTQIDDEAWSAVRSSLDNNMPVMVSGDGKRGGHAFILDGYRSSYYHYNLGWGGSNNGWYDNGSISNDNYTLTEFFTNIQPATGRTLASGKTDNGISYSQDDTGVLNISGTGSIPSLSGNIPYAATECNIAEGITGIDDYALQFLSISKLTIPSTLTKIGEAPFFFNEFLVDIEVAPENKVLSSPNNNCLYDKATCTLVNYSSEASTIVFPEGVKHIGASAFANSSATSIDIPEGVESIGMNAFSVAGVTEIHIPSSLKSIGTYAFEYSKIAKFTNDAMYPMEMDSRVLYNLPSTAVLYVPYEAVDRYKADANWSSFSAINAISGSETWENPNRIKVALSSAGTLASKIKTDYGYIHELILSGDINGDDIKVIRDIAQDGVGKIFVLDMKDARIVKGGGKYLSDFQVTENDVIPAHMLQDSKVCQWILPSSTKTIETDCLPKGLETIDLPDGLKKICDFAFAHSSLTSLYIPASVEEIGEYSVYVSTALTTLEVAPANTHYKSVDNTIYTIDGKTAVAAIYQRGTKLVVPDGVEKIYAGAYGNGYYRSVTLPASITSIGDYSLTSTKLGTIYCKATTPPALSAQAVNSSRVQYTTVHVPVNCAAAYKKAKNWSGFKFVEDESLGIDAIYNDAEDEGMQQIHTLTGEPVPSGQTLRPGIYIRNGGKILVR